jgi:hypothetical protein
MPSTRKFLAIAALGLIASASIAGVAHADWIDPYGYIHGCRSFINHWGFFVTRCF